MALPNIGRRTTFPSTGINFTTPNLGMSSSYVGPSVTTNTSFGSFTTGLFGGGTSFSQNSQGLTGTTFNPAYVKGSFGDSNFGSRSFQEGGSLTTGSKTTSGNKQPFKFLGATGAQWGQGIGVATDIGQNLLSAIAGPKMGSNGPNAGLTQGLDSAYDAASNAIMQANPLIGGIMKGVGLAGNILNAAGGGTDGMTTVDGVLNSAPMTLLTLGLNGFLGDKAETMTKDSEAFDQVGSSYGGTGDLVEDALSKAGKKYGLLSGGARDKANQLIRKAKAQQGIMSDIAGSAKDSFAIQSSMTNINNNRRANRLQGGYNQAAVRVGKQGLKIKRIVSAYNMQVKLQNGGKPKDPFEVYLTSLPTNLQDTTNYRMRDYWEYNNRPKDFTEAIQKGMFTWKQDGWHAKSVAENPKTGEIEYMKSSNHPTRYMESDWYEKGLVYDEDENGNIISIKLSPGVDGYDDWLNFTKNYELQKTEPYWKYVKRKGSPAPQSYDEGGIVREVAPSFTFSFKSGGSFNIIPEGALHARKHNMDMEGITNKGIPVISKGEGGEIEQQAEIEREEIIFRLEVTKKLEELKDKYTDDDSSQKEKDEVAIEAGKLLVQEILYNTKDNTNNLI